MATYTNDPNNIVFLRDSNIVNDLDTTVTNAIPSIPLISAVDNDIRATLAVEDEKLDNKIDVTKANLLDDISDLSTELHTRIDVETEDLNDKIDTTKTTLLNTIDDLSVELHTKIDTRTSELDVKIDTLSATTLVNFGAVNSDIDEINDKLTNGFTTKDLIADSITASKVNVSTTLDSAEIKTTKLLLAKGGIKSNAAIEVTNGDLSVKIGDIYSKDGKIASEKFVNEKVSSAYKFIGSLDRTLEELSNLINDHAILNGVNYVDYYKTGSVWCVKKPQIEGNVSVTYQNFALVVDPATNKFELNDIGGIIDTTALYTSDVVDLLLEYAELNAIISAIEYTDDKIAIVATNLANKTTELEDAIDTKVEKKTTTDISKTFAYTYNSIGDNAIAVESSAGIANSLVQRDIAGLIKTITPVADADVPTKKYVDDKDADLEEQVNAKVSTLTTTESNAKYAYTFDSSGNTKTKMSVTDEAGSIVIRDSSSYILAKNPTAPSHVATKKYVDDKVDGFQTTLTDAIQTQDDKIQDIKLSSLTMARSIIKDDSFTETTGNGKIEGSWQFEKTLSSDGGFYTDGLATIANLNATNLSATDATIDTATLTTSNFNIDSLTKFNVNGKTLDSIIKETNNISAVASTAKDAIDDATDISDIKNALTAFFEAIITALNYGV